MLRRRLKSFFGSVLFGSGAAHRLFRNRAIVAVFHRIADNVPANPITCTTAEFSAYCALFARHFDVITVSELLRRLKTRESIDRCLVITFDDGYADNALFAAPELKRHGLPACFFIATDLIGTKTIPWWDAEWGIQSQWMSWDQVRSLRDAGFEIGGHTMTHIDLGKIEGEAATQEIVGGKLRLERELQQPVRFFSYPYGRRNQITEANRATVRRVGFECCFSAYGGSVHLEDDRYHLQRAPVSPWHLSPMQYAFEMAVDERAG